LFLVAALSARWDWYPTEQPTGKVVWCELDVGRSDSAVLPGACTQPVRDFNRVYPTAP